MYLPLFLANKIYHSNSNHKKVSTPAITIATLGVAIGIAVMIVSICVVLGFKHTIRDKVIGFGSHITITDSLSTLSNEQFPIVFNDTIQKLLKTTPGIKQFQRYTYKQGILKTNSDFLGVILKGVGQDYDETFIRENLVKGEIPKFSDKENQGKIVISQYMADKLQLKVGQRLYAYFINEQGVRTRRFLISGIYQTNLSRFDDVICLTDLYTCNKLNGWNNNQVGGIEVTLDNFTKLPTITQHINKKLNTTLNINGYRYNAMTIKEMNPQIFSWLDLMDINVWIIIALMIAVACVSMISGLLIIILERTQMIGILKALGAHNRTIRHTFIYLATFIVGRGLLLGDILGLGIVALQRYTGIVKLNPQIYYVNIAPVEINLPFIIALNLITLGICIFIMIAPSYFIAKIHPAKSMHYE